MSAVRVSEIVAEFYYMRWYFWSLQIYLSSLKCLFKLWGFLKPAFGLNWGHNKDQLQIKSSNFQTKPAEILRFVGAVYGSSFIRRVSPFCPAGWFFFQVVCAAVPLLDFSRYLSSLEMALSQIIRFTRNKATIVGSCFPCQVSFSQRLTDYLWPFLNPRVP